MKKQLWYTAAIVLSLSVWGASVCGASPAAPEHAAASSGTAPTTSSNPSATSGSSATAPNTAPSASGTNGGSSANRTNGAPSNTPYPLVTVSVNQKQLPTQGILINGHTLVPIIDLVDRLGGKAMWDTQNKTLWAAFPRQRRTLRMVVGSPDARIYQYNEKDPHRTGNLIATTHLDQPPMLLGGYVVAPADAAANIVRAKVFYKPESKQVSIVGPASRQAASR